MPPPFGAQSPFRTASQFGTRDVLIPRTRRREGGDMGLGRSAAAAEQADVPLEEPRDRVGEGSRSRAGAGPLGTRDARTRLDEERTGDDPLEPSAQRDRCI